MNGASSGNPTPGVKAMPEKEKEDGKKAVPWEMKDPKPPVIQSGHMEAHRENSKYSVPGPRHGFSNEKKRHRIGKLVFPVLCRFLL